MNTKSQIKDSAAKKSDVTLRHMLGLSMALVCLLVGLGLTFFMYHYFVRADQDRIREHLVRGTQVLASTPSATEVDPDANAAFKALDVLADDIALDKHIDQTVLDNHLWQAQSPLVEAVGIRYLPRVRFNESLQKTQMMNLSSQWTDFDIPLKSYNAKEVPELDDTRKGEYFPVLYSAGESLVENLSGLDFLSDPSMRVAMNHSRDTGIQTYRKTFPRAAEKEPYLFYVTFKPLYSGIGETATVNERRQALVGFLSAVVMIRANIFIELIPESYQGLHAVFISQPGNFSTNTLEPDVQTLINNRDYALARVQTAGPETLVLTKPSYGQMLSLQRNDRWWALSIGLLLTIWLSSLLLSDSRGSLKMQKLVEKRTADLAERTRKLEEVNLALQKSESLYRMVATNVHDIIFSHDLAGICTYISPSVRPVLGYEVDAIVGHPIYAILSEKSKAKVASAIGRAKENMDEYDEYRVYEHEIFSKSGVLKTMECTASLLSDEAGNIAGVLVVSRDVTDRIKDQEEKEKLKLAVQQAQKMEAIGTLAGGIAHDFNNLLTGILGHAELIQANPQLDESTEHSASVIETAALRGKQLTTQLLGFARKGRFQAKPVNINNMIVETVQLFERTLGKDINISCKLCSQATIVTGDPGQINQVLLNLAVNSRDAMPDGGNLVFKTAVREFCVQDALPEMKPGFYCEITVSDTGIGIPKEIIDRIFEPFFSNKEEGKGTGLGLAMVYGVVTNHGGKVFVYSEPGKGAVFKIYLPLSNSASIERTPDDVQAAVKGSGRVLVVDDEKIVRDLVEKLLETLGYQTTAFEDAAKAITYYKQHWQEVDLIIMDLVMPAMGGLDCLRIMRTFNPQLKALISTGYTSEVIDEKLDEDYILGFLQKPFLLKELSDRVQASLNRVR